MTVISAVILLGVLIFIHELGHFLVAKLMNVKVLRFSLGFGPRVVGRKLGETEYMISAVPLGGYVKMLGEEPGEELKDDEKARAFHHQTLWKRTLIVLAGPVFNILLTYAIYTGVLAFHLPVTIPNLDSLMPVIDEVVDGSPAHRAGLQDGDRIVSIDGMEIDTWFDMVRVIRERPGKEIQVVIRRGEEYAEYTVMPESVTIDDGEGGETVIGRIGVMKKDANFYRLVRSDSVPEALLKGATATYYMGCFIFDSIRMLVRGDVSFRNFGGPITIVRGSAQAASAGLPAYLMFMAIISVNLGILNLLPIPVLDGGHIMLFTIEKLKGRPLDEKTINVAHRIGFAFLIALMIVAFYNDIMRIFVWK